MKAPKAAKVEKAVAGNKDGRYSIQNAYLDCEDEQPYLVATDGHILVAVPVEADKAEHGFISPDALKAARKGKGDVISVSCNGNLALPDGQTFPRPDSQGVTFPRWRAVMPKADRPYVVKIGLNPTLLKNLADAMGAETVCLEIETATHAVKVTSLRCEEGCKESIGVIMPVKV